MIQRRVLSEDEAKAALAERRRLAREEAEKQAELERLRIEEEHQLQLKLQAEEEERQRQFELEAQRLVEEQRIAEEKRLQQAIEEARQREEAERLRKGNIYFQLIILTLIANHHTNSNALHLIWRCLAEEEQQRIEREEQERKAREEAEKQKIEVAERLKKEEKEREERRKRVEAIMSRTRAKTAAANNLASAGSNKVTPTLYLYFIFYSHQYPRDAHFVVFVVKFLGGKWNWKQWLKQPIISRGTTTANTKWWNVSQ